MKSSPLRALVTLFLALSLLLASCSPTAENETERQAKASETENILQPESQTEASETESKPLFEHAKLSRASDIFASMETITLSWFNATTDKTLYCSNAFRIERLEDGKWIDCTPETPIYASDPLTVPARTEIDRDYNITGFDLSRDLPYRFIGRYNETGDSRDDVDIILEFTLGYNFKLPEPKQAELVHISDGKTSEPKAVTYYYFRKNGGKDGDFDKYCYHNPEFATFLQYTPNLSVYTNLERFDLQGVNAIPMVRIDSVEDIDLLKQYGTSRPWEYLADSYDAAFFETKTLFLLSFTEGSGSISHDITLPLTVEGESFYIPVKQISPNGAHTADELPCEMLFEIERADIKDCTVFDAWMN